MRQLDGRASSACWLGTRWLCDGNCRTERPFAHSGSHYAASAAHGRGKSTDRSNTWYYESWDDESQHDHSWNNQSERNQ